MINEPEPNTRAGEALKPCPWCNAELTVPTPVQHPKMGLARLHPGSIDDGSCPIAGWGFYAEQLERWNTRAQLDAKDAMIDGQAALIATLTAERDKARADGDKLAGFAEHDSACPASWPEFIATDCTCGLTQALTEWKDRA